MFVLINIISVISETKAYLYDDVFLVSNTHDTKKMINSPFIITIIMEW